MARHPIAAVVLAAGRSARLGHPKQLVVFAGRSLIRRVIETMLYSQVDDVVVVLGAFAPKLRPQVDVFSVDVVVNRSWHAGIGNSIKAGVNFLLGKEQTPTGIMLVLCDQPFLSLGVIDQLVEKFRNDPTGITACEYDGQVGVPAIFGEPFFSQLQVLEPSMGAKKIIYDNLNRVQRVTFPKGEVDVDVPDDINRLIPDANEESSVPFSK